MIKPGPRFEVKHVSPVEWVIHDHAYDENDPRRVVACIWEAAAGKYEVTWVRRLPLPRRYESVSAVLDDVHAFTSLNTKPVPIPHLPPPRARAAAAV